MPRLVLIMNGGTFVKVYHGKKMVAQFQMEGGSIHPDQVKMLQQASVAKLQELSNG